MSEQPTRLVDRPIMMQLGLRVEFETPPNVGGHGAPLFVDRPFRRDANGWPYIPASTLKGRLRHECERLVQASGRWVCDSPNPKRMCPNYLSHRGEICAVCAIFGSPWCRGNIWPEELLLREPEELAREREQGKEAPFSTARFGVSLSRRRRVAEDARLFTTELFLPGVPLVFGGTWGGRLTLSQLALVEAGCGAINALGRGKTGGLGWCRVTVESQVQENDAWRAVREEERAEGRAAWA
jgi:CRISPR/Cas system CSM-associated protein Csm3 (group 7 of RAMP superfamily)